jgi:transcriptional regulator with XRE-family HTH domain
MRYRELWCNIFATPRWTRRATVDADRSMFWDDLTQDLKDPQFQREYVAQSIRIATIDRIVNELDGAREAAGLSKAELARAINSEPATVRRLFSAGHVNPTLGTLAEVAAALGMRVVLEPLDADDRKRITEPLLEGSTQDPGVLARRLEAIRRMPDAESATA